MGRWLAMGLVYSLDLDVFLFLFLSPRELFIRFFPFVFAYGVHFFSFHFFFRSPSAGLGHIYFPNFLLFLFESFTALIYNTEMYNQPATRTTLL